MGLEQFLLLLLFFSFGIFIGYQLRDATTPDIKVKEKSKEEYKIHTNICKCSRYEYKQVNDIDGCEWKYVCKDCGKSSKTKTYFLQKNPIDYLIE